MTTVDWIIIGIVALSTVMSLWRGVTREIFSLITWVLAIYLGVKFAGGLDEILGGFISTQSVRFAVGFIIIFLLVMIAGGLLLRVLSQFITFTGLTLVDRLLGVMFGVARGVLIIAVLVVLANYSTVPKDDWWKDSQLLPHFDGVSASLSKWVQEQGFDPKKLETLIETVEGKPSGKGKQKEVKPTDTVTSAPEAATPATAPGQTSNVLGAPVSVDHAQPNMLGGQPPKADGN